MNETLRLIQSRRSHRAYKDTPVTKEQLSALEAAALASPSAVNRQNWHFSFVRDQALLSDMNWAAKEAVSALPPDKRSPRFADPEYSVFYRAPLVIFISCPEGELYPPIDCGIAVQTLALAAESMNLGSVILGMPRECFHTGKCAEFEQALRFPEGYHFCIAIAIGVPADDKEAHPVGENKVSLIG